MLLSIGQTLGPLHKRFKGAKAFNFMLSLPAEVVYERGDNVATYRDANGALALATPHQPRFDHDKNGTPLGLLVEGSRKNELATHNANPTDTSGWITGGDASGVFSVVDAPLPLNVVGFENICSGGKVFKIDNSAGASSFYVESDVTVGDLDARSCFAYICIVEGSLGTNGSFGIGYDTDQGTHIHRRDAWEKVVVENVTPSATNRRLRIKAYPGQVIHFILPQLEKGAFASSPIVTTGAAAIRALDAVYIPNLDQKPWWNETEGFMAVRYSIPVFPPASVYTIAAHNTSAESIGVRVDGASHAVRGWVRSQSATRHASSTGDPMTADTAHVMGVTWKPEEATVFSGLETYVRTWPGQSNPSGMNELRIGQRNSGSDPIYGHVKDITIGKKHLDTLADIGRIAVPKNDMLLIAGGQSNINGHFSVPDEAARNALIFEATRQAPNVQAVWINGSTGGSAVIRKNTSDPDKWWVDPLDNYAHGPAFDTFLSTAAAAGACFDYVIWAQGEADAHQIGSSQTDRAAYKAALIKVFEDIRAALGPVEIYIQFLGTRNGFTNTGGMQAVREVQKELVAEYAWIHFGAEAYDAELDTDEVHYIDAAYIELATRIGRKISKDRDADIAGTLGPAMRAVTRGGTSVTVNILHDAGDALNLTAAIEGFHFFDDGVDIPITAATSDGVSEITLELASAPSGAEVLYYIYDDEYPLDKTKIVRDNATVPMPLQSGFLQNPIMALPNLNHYSDPALSEKTYHSGTFLKEILPLKGANKMEQLDPVRAMEFLPGAFNGLGGYGFPAAARWMLYEADPAPFQVERTIGVVFDCPGPFTNNQIFGLSKYSAFNTHWRVQTLTNGNHVTFGRQETELGEWPVIIPSAPGSAYIMIVRMVSLERHEFYVNSFENPVVINPQDAYLTDNRARLLFGRIATSRAETGTIIGPAFDAFHLVSMTELQQIMEHLSARTGIALSSA